MVRYLPLLALLASSCQFNYTFPEPQEQGYHGAHGCAYMAGREACFLAVCDDDLTDEEFSDKYDNYPGNGYRDGQYSGTHPLEVSAQQYFDCEDGTGLLLEDDGTIVEV